MRDVLNGQEMKQCDENTMKMGMLSAVLMERAALSVVKEIMERYPDDDTRILTVCGAGNNGGDGIAVGRLLALQGYEVGICFAGNPEKMTTETARQMKIAKNYNVPVLTPEEAFQENWDVIVDALFGIGLSREITGKYADIIKELNVYYEGAGKIAVDIASGISATTGEVLGTAFQADVTVTFGFEKRGQLLYPGAEYTGALKVEDIGFTTESLFDIIPGLHVLEKEDLDMLPKRTAHSNKGSYGKLLLIAGSEGMAGAAVFAAKAAYRMGCGLVRVATVESNRAILQQLVPEAVLAVYNDTTDVVKFVETQLAWADAVAVGSGIGQSALSEKMVKTVIEQNTKPCLFDADALNLISKNPEWLQFLKNGAVFTPHLGEMSRLIGTSIAEISKDLVVAALQYAQKNHVVMVLKDARTVTATEKRGCFLNLSGNDGMATAGSGDVLSGVIGALLAQGMLPEDAAPMGVYLHGLAGDAAAKKLGRHSMMASDIVDGITDLLKEQEDTIEQ